MHEFVESEIPRIGPLVQDDVDGDTPGGSTA